MKTSELRKILGDVLKQNGDVELKVWYDPDYDDISSPNVTRVEL